MHIIIIILICQHASDKHPGRHFAMTHTLIKNCPGAVCALGQKLNRSRWSYGSR